MDKILLFDVDGTLVESSQKIEEKMVAILKAIQKAGYKLGVVGGGKLDKILEQLNYSVNNIYFDYYFSECGSVYHYNKSNTSLDLEEIYKKDIRNHNLYKKINKLLKVVLHFLSNVDYEITGHFIDLRHGLIYVSLIGMNANNEERNYFMDLDIKNGYKKELLEKLRAKAHELSIFNEVDIVEGGSVGIAIYPKEFDKIQVLNIIKKENFSEIHYFGDKYLEHGNDYNLINHVDIVGHRVNNQYDTIKDLEKLIH